MSNSATPSVPKQVNLPVLITCDTEYGIAEQTVRIILLELETFDIVTVITVQPFARTYPYNAPSSMYRLLTENWESPSSVVKWLKVIFCPNVRTAVTLKNSRNKRIVFLTNSVV